jgi:hypothetical protein
MKKSFVLSVFSIMVILVIQNSTQAAVLKKQTSKTEHNFSDLVISGKYQYPDEALVKVDDDKVLTDLIGYRKQCKDRLNRLESQE